jgi:hypothetical protein
MSASVTLISVPILITSWFEQFGFALDEIFHSMISGRICENLVLILRKAWNLIKVETV